MALPEMIEIVPLDKPVRAEITVPGSKSITNRALILAALAHGQVTLTGALWSEDTQIMVECLRKLGFEIRAENDPEEFCDRTITVKGLGGKIPNGGTAETPLELFVGNAGTAARFLSAFVCLGNGVYRLAGVPRMHERPQAALFQALRELGYRIKAENGNDKLPVCIYGYESFSYQKRIVEPLAPKYQEILTNEKPRSCKVSIEESSQFASALLLCAKLGGWKIEVVGENAEESSYVAMTLKLIEAFPHQGGTFEIEPDASSGSYFLAAERLVPLAPEYLEYSEKFGIEVPTQQLNRIRVEHWPNSGWQMDEPFMDYQMLGSCAREIRELERKHLPITGELRKKLREQSAKSVISRKYDLGDSIMTAIICSAMGISRKVFSFTDLGRLRVQECERVVALRTELTKCGAKVIEEKDTLTVYPSPLHGAEIETYNDHRMAMCFAILGLKVPGVKIKNPACVKKTFPNFFQKLAAAPPKGLGAEIRDAKTGRKLEVDELFAE
ncbi:MAG: 3-phosphoshikimate 1-carboxyvinyltransferase [Limisphaerales bacterium]